MLNKRSSFISALFALFLGSAVLGNSTGFCADAPSHSIGQRARSVNTAATTGESLTVNTSVTSGELPGAVGNAVTLAQAKNAARLLDYRPAQVVSKEIIDDLIKDIRSEADHGEHRFCLFDNSDRCFYRNAEFKDVLKARLKKYNEKNKSAIEWSKVTATGLIVETGRASKWSYHTVSVIYTNEGPFVFDPASKTQDEVLKGKMLFPLKDWVQKDKGFNRPVTMLAPAAVITQTDIPGIPGYFSSEVEKQKYWDSYQGALPTDKNFAEIQNLDLTDKALKYYSDLGALLIQSSKETFEKIQPEQKGL